MRSCFYYLYLQWKRFFKGLFFSLCVIFAAILLLGSCLFISYKIYSVKEMSLIKVGMVVSKDDSSSQFVLDYISSMDSVKSICSFEYMEEEEAKREYLNGKLNAIIVFPKNFYHDVYVGLNPPAIIYMHEEKTIAEKVFYELLLSGVSYLRISEAGVYSMLDAGREYGSLLSGEDIGNRVALIYFEEIMGRGKLFYEEKISGYKGLSINEFYSVNAIVILMMFSGFIFFRMYGRSDRAVEDKLRINGISKFISSILKLFIIFPVTFLLGYLYLFIMQKINIILGEEIEYDRNLMFLALIVIAFSMSLYFHMIYLFGRKKEVGVWVLLLINLSSIMSSGLLIPSVYLSSYTITIGKIMPSLYWSRLLIWAMGGK